VRIAIAARVMNILSILNILRANFEWEGRESARPRTINIPIPRFQDLSLTGHLLSLSAFPSRRAFANNAGASRRKGGLLIAPSSPESRVPSPESRVPSPESRVPRSLARFNVNVKG
jgi:hypothetical protein